MTRIGVILGSTRPGRRGEPVARWVMDEAGLRSDAEFGSGVLKNAIDFLYAQWNNKPMGVVKFKPIARQAQVLDVLFGEVIGWSQALAPRQVTRAA